MFAKDINSFTYVLPSACYFENNIEKINEGAPLRLRRISNSDQDLKRVI